MAALSRPRPRHRWLYTFIYATRRRSRSQNPSSAISRVVRMTRDLSNRHVLMLTLRAFMTGFPRSIASKTAQVPMTIFKNRKTFAHHLDT
ncbi:hypothetical protein V1525DRAFT_414730 [Lipomyces kononenkoae]|uniref:Uncharacterized protein n=1 Tax=Lipomyces kononenkoae TaxID=34357 RepID=A0ACC3SQP7_LIPKO